MKKTMEQRYFEFLYSRAKSPADLPWAQGTPERVLNKVLQKRGAPGRALDVGCGAGTFSVVMAKAGYEVTSLDFMSTALEMAERTAREAGVKLNLVQGNALEWRAEQPFDLVLDSGCLHGIQESDCPRYKEQLLRWLKPGGDYVLGHFGKRHLLDWRPMPPKRWPRRRVEGLLAPELRLQDYVEDVVTGVRLPVGPTVLLCTYGFHRPAA
jgi:ubiquinone/menaquinone biosynthesis C-methylase UbiE